MWGWQSLVRVVEVPWGILAVAAAVPQDDRIQLEVVERTVSLGHYMAGHYVGKEPRVRMEDTWYLPIEQPWRCRLEIRDLNDG